MALYNVSETVRNAQKQMGRQGVTDRLHYVYRCYSCARLITKLEILEARAAGRVELCPCGSKMIRPTNAKLWEELCLPRCWKLIYLLHTKQIAPAPPPPTPEEQEEANKLGIRATRAFEAQMAQMVRQSGTR